MSESIPIVTPDAPVDDIQEQLIRASARIVLAVVAVLFSAFFLLVPSRSSTVKKLLKVDRRSVEVYLGPAPKATVMRALEAAIHAPNHFLNEPWRFRLLGPETIKKVIEAVPAKKDFYDKCQVPGMMMVSCVPSKMEGQDKWNLKSLEDHAATACAVQNFMLSMASENCATKWMTGKMGIPAPEMMKLCGADDKEEHYMGIIFYGKPGEKPTVKPRKTGLNSPVLTELP